MKSLLRRLVPPAWQMQARRLCYLPLEARDWLLGRRGLLPPRWLRVAGAGDFVTIGRRLAGHFRELAALRPGEDVLDVGCGAGRVALALLDYLGERGSYHGFDVLRPAVRWCQRNITPGHPNFRFDHADVRNGGYNPVGRFRATEFHFPYPDASFDFACATSVFTHMLPDEVAHYLAEVRRVLRPGGRCLATVFILDADARCRMARAGSTVDFRHQGPGYWTTNRQRPEEAVAYTEGDLLAMFEGAGLRSLRPFWPGGWCGRDGAREGQDMAVAYRN
jgi:SAM-dependent methyltransferase